MKLPRPFVQKALFAILLFSGAACALQIRAQSPAATEQPKFEVASVIVDKSGVTNAAGSHLEPGGRFVVTNSALTGLLLIAYQLKRPDQIVRLPDWAVSERFDIEAKAEGIPAPSREQLSAMVRALLADRFKLTVHRETKQLPVYALVVANPGKTGPGLVADAGNKTGTKKCWDTSTPMPPLVGGIPPVPCDGLSVNTINGVTHLSANLPMDQFAASLSRIVDGIVLDRTGLTGVFVFALEYTPLLTTAAPSNDPSAPPSIFTAMPEQLGLKLVPQTGPVDVVVIDHVEQPSPN